MEQRRVLSDAKIPLPKNIKKAISSQGSEGFYVVWNRATDINYILLSQDRLRSENYEFIGSYKVYEPAGKTGSSSGNYQIRVPKEVSKTISGFSEGDNVYFVALNSWLEKENSRVYLLTAHQFPQFLSNTRLNTLGDSDDPPLKQTRLPTSHDTIGLERQVDLKARFIDDHRDSLIKVAKTFENEDADYILALTRRAPRLLELMQDELNWPAGTPIITEKSVDFMPQKQLGDENIILFDDIIISGSTIETTRKELSDYYPGIDIETVTTAIDDETIALEKNEIDYKKPLTRSERFTFSRDIVRAINSLNKPYDTDYALFRTRFDQSTVSDLTAHDEAYNLTSKHHDLIGQQRYTFLLEEPLKNLTDDILAGDSIINTITKVRLYYDESTRQCTITPMAIFSVEKSDLKDEIFAEPVAHFNELVEDIGGFLSTSEEGIAIYRFVWFIVSYLHGLAFSFEYHPEEEEQLLQFSSPSDLFDFQDISYLFGPTVTQKTLDFFDSHYTETEEALKSLCQNASSKHSNTKKSSTLQPDEALKLDKKQNQTYGKKRNKISEYITANLTTDASALSVIFEAMYAEIEIPEQKNLRAQVETQTPRQNRETLREHHERLETGLNYWQMKQILAEHGVTLDREPLSLTIDHLVDNGVQIPGFYEREIEGEEKNRLERVYRYGENAEERLAVPQIVDESVETVFEYLAEKNNKEHVNKIPFEKIGVMLADKTIDIDQYWPEDLHEPQIFQPPLEDTSTVNADRNFWEPAVEYDRHGRVLNIDGSLFTDWAKTTEIVKEAPNAGGVSRCENWKKNHTTEREFNVQPNTGSQLLSCKSLARCLIEIEEVVDPATGDYLTAITTCRDKKTLLESMQEEFRLFFEDSDWTFGNAIEKSGELESYDQLQNRVLVSPDSGVYTEFEDDLEEWLRIVNTSYEVANAVKHKHQLWSELNEIIEEINEHFENHNNFSFEYDYKRELQPLLKNITTAKYPPEPGRSLISKSVFFGGLCISLSSISQALLKLSLHILDERGSEGVSHNTRQQIKEISQQINQWNSYARNEAKLKEELSVNSLPTINEREVSLEYRSSEDNSVSDLQDPRMSVHLLNDYWPQIETAFKGLESIYVDEFRNNWEETISDLSRQEKWEMVTHTWTIWYEVKDYTGEYDPENKRRANEFEDQIEPHLKELKTHPDVKDGLWDTQNYSRYIFLKDSGNIQTYLSRLLKVAADHKVFLHIGVSRIPYADLKRHKYRDTLKSDEAHKLAKKVGSHQKKETEEHDPCYSMNIDKKAINRLGNSIYPPGAKEDWKRTTVSEDITKRFEGLTKPVKFDSVKLVSAHSLDSEEDA